MTYMGSRRDVCGARLSNDRGRCRARPAKGRVRCRFHGGASTGPRTREGMQCTIAAMVAGRNNQIPLIRTDMPIRADRST
jgi:hypothetical protein